MPIDPPEIPPATPGKPTEPPPEAPPGNPRPEVPPFDVIVARTVAGVRHSLARRPRIAAAD